MLKGRTHRREWLRRSAIGLFVCCAGCGPNPRKKFVGVWRLDADYFREQLEAQAEELQSEDAKAALQENIPLWESFKQEYVFSADGRYQVSTQIHGGKIVTVRGRYSTPDGARSTLQLIADDESEPTNVVYRFVNDDTLEIDADLAPPGYPKTARYLRAKAETMNAQAEEKGAT